MQSKSIELQPLISKSILELSRLIDHSNRFNSTDWVQSIETLLINSIDFDRVKLSSKTNCKTDESNPINDSKIEIRINRILFNTD